MNKDPTMMEEQVVSLAEEGKQDSPVLLDETDVVIEDFKQRLKNLQNQLYQKQADRAHEREAVASVATYLSQPAKDLSTRLQHLLSTKVNDTHLYDELEACLETANTLHAFLEKMGTSHSNVMRTLMGEGRLFPLSTFDNEMQTHVVDGNCSYADTLGDSASLSHHQIDGAIFSMVAVFLEGIREVLGYQEHVRIHCSLQEEQGETILHMQLLGKEAFCVAKTSQTTLSGYAWDALGDKKAGVALLYAEKILEIKKGKFSFLQQQENIYGISIAILVAS